MSNRLFVAIKPNHRLTINIAIFVRSTKLQHSAQSYSRADSCCCNIVYQRTRKNCGWSIKFWAINVHEDSFTRAEYLAKTRHEKSEFKTCLQHFDLITQSTFCFGCRHFSETFNCNINIQTLREVDKDSSQLASCCFLAIFHHEACFGANPDKQDKADRISAKYAILAAEAISRVEHV